MASGARHLAQIHGTEEDRVNCPFYFKIGACRHGDTCSRAHHPPAFSQCLLLKHCFRHVILEGLKNSQAMAQAESKQAGGSIHGSGDSGGSSSSASHIEFVNLSRSEAFLAHFEDLYLLLSKFGRIQTLQICTNLGEHMVGNVYAKFNDEEQVSERASE